MSLAVADWPNLPPWELISKKISSQSEAGLMLRLGGAMEFQSEQLHFISTQLIYSDVKRSPVARSLSCSQERGALHFARGVPPMDSRG